jgi:hypothetical protein
MNKATFTLDCNSQYIVYFEEDHDVADGLGWNVVQGEEPSGIAARFQTREQAMTWMTTQRALDPCCPLDCTPKLVGENDNMMKATFTLDGEGSFVGYHDPDVRWNGWACPFFPIESVREIAALTAQMAAEFPAEDFDVIEVDDDGRVFYVSRECGRVEERPGFEQACHSQVNAVIEMFEMNGFDRASLLRDLEENEANLRTDLLSMAKQIADEDGGDGGAKAIKGLDTQGLERAIRVQGLYAIGAWAWCWSEVQNG